MPANLPSSIDINVDIYDLGGERLHLSDSFKSIPVRFNQPLGYLLTRVIIITRSICRLNSQVIMLVDMAMLRTPSTFMRLLKLPRGKSLTKLSHVRLRWHLQPIGCYASLIMDCYAYRGYGSVQNSRNFCCQ